MFDTLFDHNVNHILCQIFMHLDPPDLRNCTKVSKRWCQFVNQDLMQNAKTKDILEQRFINWQWLNEEPKVFKTNISFSKRILEAACDGNDLFLRISHQLWLYEDAIRFRGVIDGFPAAGKMFIPPGGHVIINNDVLADKAYIWSRINLELINTMILDKRNCRMNVVYDKDFLIFMEMTEDSVMVLKRLNNVTGQVTNYRSFPMINLSQEKISMTPQHVFTFNKKNRIMKLWDHSKGNNIELKWEKKTDDFIDSKVKQIFLTDTCVTLFDCSKVNLCKKVTVFDLNNLGHEVWHRQFGHDWIISSDDIACTDKHVAIFATNVAQDEEGDQATLVGKASQICIWDVENKSEQIFENSHEKHSVEDGSSSEISIISDKLVVVYIKYINKIFIADVSDRSNKTVITLSYPQMSRFLFHGCFNGCHFSRASPKRLFFKQSSSLVAVEAEDSKESLVLITVSKHLTLLARNLKESKEEDFKVPRSTLSYW